MTPWDLSSATRALKLSLSGSSNTSSTRRSEEHTS